MSPFFVPCPQCRRHVLTSETACPFCRSALPADAAAAVLWAGDRGLRLRAV